MRRIAPGRGEIANGKRGHERGAARAHPSYSIPPLPIVLDTLPPVRPPACLPLPACPPAFRIDAIAEVTRAIPAALIRTGCPKCHADLVDSISIRPRRLGVAVECRSKSNLEFVLPRLMSAERSF